jgi:hypothetical protein
VDFVLSAIGLFRRVRGQVGVRLFCARKKGCGLAKGCCEMDCSID